MAQLVERVVRDDEVARSNRVTRTIVGVHKGTHIFYFISLSALFIVLGIMIFQNNSDRRAYFHDGLSLCLRV